MREIVEIGDSKPQKKHLDAVVAAYCEGRMSLFVGAGTSIPYGIPNWEELVTGLLLSEAGDRFKNFYPNYRAALASWLSQNFDFSPTSLARVVKYNLRKNGAERTLRGALQKRLYANFFEPKGPDTLLDEIVRFIQREPAKIRRVVNLNFDDLLVRKLREAGVPAYARYRSSAPRSKGLEVLHPHGFVPRPGENVPQQELVFTEDEYNRLTLEPLHWAATEIASTLRNSIALFLGLSMNDPNLRRILDSLRSGRREQKPRHYLLRLDYLREHIDLGAAVAEVQQRAERELDRRMSRSPEMERWIKKKPEEVERAIGRALRQAHTYDRQLFKDLGVGTLWVNDFADMPKVLDWIRRQTSS